MEPLEVSESATNANEARGRVPENPWKSFRVWMVLLAMGVAKFQAALDLTAVSTALPTISDDIHVTSFIWVGSAYALASTVTLPFFGSCASIFGRKIVLCAVIVIFAAGSAICGSAPDQAAMIAGRTVQGLGGGGILAVTDIMLTDMFPLSMRGQAIGFFGMVWAFAAAIGPPIGGALADTDWRWLFYLNIPLCFIAMGLVIVFCDLKHPMQNAYDRLKAFDFLGNFIFVAGSTGTVLGFSWADSPYTWDSAPVLVPLICGLAVMVLFAYVERKVLEPAVPPVLLSNWTSAIGYMATCLHSICVLTVVYYLPIYFQAVKGTTAVRSGVNLFSLSFTIAPSAIAAGVLVSVTKKYKALNVIAWSGSALSFGLMCLLEPDSVTGLWAGIPVLVGISLGLLYTATLFPVAAPLPPHLGAPMMAFYNFCQNFGQVLGVTLGGIILQNDLPQRLSAKLSSEIDVGGDAAYSLIPLIPTLSPTEQMEVKSAITGSLRMIWVASAVISGVGMLISLFMRRLPLGYETDERFGVKEE